jgi:hypothetical protein
MWILDKTYGEANRLTAVKNDKQNENPKLMAKFDAEFKNN